MKRRALVLGGSGYVGSAVVRELARRDVDVFCTYFGNENGAKLLAEETRSALVFADLREDTAPLEEWIARERPSIVVHAAAHFEARDDASNDAASHLGAFDDAMKIGPRAVHSLVTALANRHDGKSRLDVVIVGALDRAQSLPLPPHFAAAEGAKSALAMALAKKYGEKNVRVNMVALGLLERGLSRKIGESIAHDFEQFSALGRRGTADEVAKVIAFLALDSDFLTGKTIAVNGGL